MVYNHREQAFSGVAERVITALFLPACPQTRISKQLGDQNSESVIERRAEMAVIRDLDLFHRVDSLLYAQRAFNEIKNGIFGKIARTRYVLMYPCTCILCIPRYSNVCRMRLNNQLDWRIDYSKNNQNEKYIKMLLVYINVCNLF